MPGKPDPHRHESPICRSRPPSPAAPTPAVPSPPPHHTQSSGGVPDHKTGAHLSPPSLAPFAPARVPNLHRHAPFAHFAPLRAPIGPIRRQRCHLPSGPIFRISAKQKPEIQSSASGPSSRPKYLFNNNLAFLWPRSAPDSPSKTGSYFPSAKRIRNRTNAKKKKKWEFVRFVQFVAFVMKNRSP